MGASKSSFKPRKFYKLRTDKATKQPSFIEQVKDEKTGKYIDGDHYTVITGYLTSVRCKTFEYEGKQKESVMIELQDNTDQEMQLVIETGWNFLARSILNTLASPTNIGHVKISVYKSKNGYPSAYLECAGRKTGWKYTVDELPKGQEIVFKGEKMWDDSAVNEFFKTTVIPQINTRTTNEFLAEAELRQPQVQPTTRPSTEPHTEVPVEDDLPF
jgi:hypothetical protein